VVVIGAAAGGFVWAEHASVVRAASASPKENAYLSSKSVELSWSLTGYRLGKGSISLIVDGAPVANPNLTLKPGEVQASLSLADGPHSVRMDYDSSNLFSRHLTRSWAFTVDTTPPAIQMVSPSVLTTLGSATTSFEADFSETVAATSLSVDGTSTPLALKGETGQCTVTLSPGNHQFAVSATDLAGNTTVKQWQALAEFGTPDIQPTSWPGATWTKPAAPLSFTVGDAYPDQLTVSAHLDDKPLALLAEATPASATQPGTPDPPSRSYALDLSTLAQGVHELVIKAENAGGHTATWQQSFLVNTTETFGQVEMIAGAVGQDVKELQQVLEQKGFYQGSPTGVFDASTAQAVTAYRQSQGLSPQPVVDWATLELLLGSIVVDRGKCQLYLYEGTRLVKTYTVAVGQPAWPTPVGNFVIISKQVDPTWYPPDSSWAAGAKPIGPGPADPLQARVMWLSAPAVGIHGTNEPWSVGSHASHGCIRMRVPDVEDLYNRVFVGTPVQIVD
jgi:lipoprotein-anchoring transpeptidase ErfK/SrfK